MKRLFGMGLLVGSFVVVALGQQPQRSAQPLQTGPEMHGMLKVHSYTMIDADLRVDNEACSFSESTKEVICLKEGGVDVDILLSQEDAPRFYPGLDMNCVSAPASRQYKACKFDILGEAITSLPTDAFKIYCGVENRPGLPPTPGAFPIDGAPCDAWREKNKVVTQELCQPEDLLEGGKYYPPPCHKSKSAKYDFEKDSITQVTHCEDKITGHEVNCITGPAGSSNALVPVTYRIVTVRSAHGSTSYFVRLEDGAGHIGYYEISEQKEDAPKAATVLK